MSLVAQYHAEHKARIMRMGGYKPPVKEQPKPAAPVFEWPRPCIFVPEYYYRNMWFWELVTFTPKRDSVTSPPLSKITRIVARHFGITLKEMMSPRRYRPFVIPRQVAAYLACKHTMRSLPEIGRFMKRDHTTILHSRRKVEEYAKHPEMKAILERLTFEILAP